MAFGLLQTLDRAFVRGVVGMASRAALWAAPDNGGLQASLSPVRAGEVQNSLWVLAEGVCSVAGEDGNAARATLTGPELSLGHDRSLGCGGSAGPPSALPTSASVSGAGAPGPTLIACPSPFGVSFSI